MPTFRKEFKTFIADRLGNIDDSYKEIHTLYHDIPDEIAEEIVSKIESFASERAYKIGFIDGIRLMAGL